jgi:hypothetical protein
MLAVLRQLVTPLRYLKVKSSGGEKFTLDIYLPAVLAVATCTAISLFPNIAPMLGEHGFVANLNNLLQTLTGFYVGALAAVATFPNPTMDQKTDNLYLGGELIERRIFLAKLFAYLAVLAFTLYVIGLFISFPAHIFHEMGEGRFKFCVRVVACFVYLFIFWQMLSITLLGLYYLCDRIHRKSNAKNVAK